MTAANPCDTLVAEAEDMLAAWWSAPPETASERRCRQRQEAAITAGRVVLRQLLEPWQDDPSAGEVLRLALGVHLYARVLDDAVDEGLPAYRLALLRAQPYLWALSAEIARRWPARAASTLTLIQEGVDATAGEWRAVRPDDWGRKNHHLLLAPLLASEDVAWFEVRQEALSRYLLLLQTREELGQGVLAGGRARRLRRMLEGWMDAHGWLGELRAGGWGTAAGQARSFLAELALALAHLEEEPE